MKIAELHKKLIAAARNAPPADQVPYAFEKRIMARLAGQTAPDSWTLWARALSRAAAICVIFMLVLSAGSFFMPTAIKQETLSQAVEQSLFAAVDNNNADQETW